MPGKLQEHLLYAGLETVLQKAQLRPRSRLLHKQLIRKFSQTARLQLAAKSDNMCILHGYRYLVALIPLHGLVAHASVQRADLQTA